MMFSVSKNQAKLLSNILENGWAGILECEEARQNADLKFDRLASEFGCYNDFTAMRKSSDVTVQLIQHSILKLNEAEMTDVGGDLAKEALRAQLEYMRLVVNIFERRL